MKPFVVHSPARVCLYGDHQDYLSLPVIAGTIDRYMHFEVSACTKQSFEFDLADLGQNFSIPMDPSLAYKQEQGTIDFFRAGLRVAGRHGYIPKHGLRVRITSDIPINAGVSSSSALMVGWIYTLVLAFNDGRTPSKDKLGQMAFEAEVIEHQSPGGQMDQYTIAYGDLVHIKTGENIQVNPLPKPRFNLILANSKIKKQTLSTIGAVRKHTKRAFEQIRQTDQRFSLTQTTIIDLNDKLHLISSELRHYAVAAVRNHEITKTALKELSSPEPEISKLGALMSAHHRELSQNLKVSHPKIDRWIELGLKNGAYGAKIVGSGHGGCMIFMVPNDTSDKFCHLLRQAGVPAAYSINIEKACHHAFG